ncbi:MAG: stage V sporulation protein AD [Eubacteriales bacterium]|nr:stage V sporulation protein AD [Eubacteriales bacterium]
MGQKRLGRRTVQLTKNIGLISWASVVGPKEGSGPLASFFDEILSDDKCGCESFEKAEGAMMKRACDMALRKGGLTPEAVDVMLGGDLLNQIITAAFTARDYPFPFLGLYGACSTMSESLLVAALILESDGFDTALCVTSSHFSSAERQYRAPLELGNQRTPAAQWTVTGSGATVLSTVHPARQFIRAVTVGSVCDYGITDSNNMGAAMAPAAIDTLMTHFADTGRRPCDYDLIVTGDLGLLGAEIVREQCRIRGLDLGDRYFDCGERIFDTEQDAHCGGSGCACSAVTLNGYILEQMRRGTARRVLFLATGALLSVLSAQQGESIPGIAHAVVIENEVSS